MFCRKDGQPQYILDTKCKRSTQLLLRKRYLSSQSENSCKRLKGKLINSSTLAFTKLFTLKIIICFHNLVAVKPMKRILWNTVFGSLTIAAVKEMFHFCIIKLGKKISEKDHQLFFISLQSRLKWTWNHNQYKGLILLGKTKYSRLTFTRLYLVHMTSFSVNKWVNNFVGVVTKTDNSNWGQISSSLLFTATLWECRF